MVESNPNPAPEETKDVVDEQEYWIGIDLGTTFTAAALWKDHQVIMLQNPDDGNHTTPSVVSYTTKGDILVGNQAIRQTIRNLEGTIVDAKRMVGRKFSDDVI